MTRAVDAVLEFLEGEKSRGVTHVLLDEGAREGLRELFLRTKNGGDPPAAADSPTPAAGPAVEPAPAAPAALVAPQEGSRQERLEALKRQAEQWAPARRLGTLRETMVFSTGDPAARVMLVGEAPGHHEEQQREPFVGPAGQKLNDILKAMNLPRAAVYLTNIVKFRPSTPRQTLNNRKPTAEEIEACLPFLREEIRIVQPACIVALGESAAAGLLGLEGAVAELRGPWRDFEGTPVRITYHPSHLLQSAASTPVKRQLWEDMLAVMELAGIPISDRQRAFFQGKP